MMEGLKLSISQRINLIRITLVLSLLISVLLSLNLWCGDRSFPVTPILQVNWLNSSYDFIWIVLVILFWITSLFLRFQRVFIFLACLFCFFLILFDLNRLQPWFFMYNSLLVMFIFYNGRVDEPNKNTSFFIIIQLIFASFYFFNGISCLNDQFVKESFEVIISPIQTLVSERHFIFLKKIGYLVPYLLMFIGLGLIISSIRYLAISIAFLLHLMLLVLYFPSANHLNYSLWFSNLSFIILLFFLFSGNTKQTNYSFIFLFNRILFYPVFVFFVVLPFFNLINKWPDFLSSNSKGGNNIVLELRINKKNKQQLPFYERFFLTPTDSLFLLDYQHWCLHELNSDCIPSERVFNSILNYFNALNDNKKKGVVAKITK